MSESEELFTTRVRKATRNIHSVSDSLVNAKFAISLKDNTVWGGGLFVFYHIFSYLEDAQKRLNMPDYDKLFVHKILYRKQKFEEDLIHYMGTNWQSAPKSQALDNYLDRLQSLEQENPRMLMVYVYHMYLGLLSGGQIIAKKRGIFGEKNGKKNPHVDKVFDFADVDIGQLKKDFLQAMNEIAENMSDEEKTAFIDESSHLFIMNNLVVNSIEGQNKVVFDLLYKASAVVLLVVGVMLAYKACK